MIQHGQAINWTTKEGAKLRVVVSHHESRQAAVREAFDAAERMGWTPPRWWEWWRWRDVPRQDFRGTFQQAPDSDSP